MSLESHHFQHRLSIARKRSVNEMPVGLHLSWGASKVSAEHKCII